MIATSVFSNVYLSKIRNASNEEIFIYIIKTYLSIFIAELNVNHLT